MSARGADARIVDRGYQHYRGPRLGQAHAARAMLWAAVRRALGIRRSFIFKLVPGVLLLITYGDVLIQATGARVVGTAIISYPSVYAHMAILFLVFAAVAAPTLLCADRRERVTSLYFAAPITRGQYVGAQYAGLVILLLLFTLVPILLLFASYTFLSPSAGAYLHDHLGDLWHIILAGGLLALYYAAAALACAALTDRHAYATGACLGAGLVSVVAAGILQNLPFAGHERFALVDLVNLPVHAVRWLFGTSPATGFSFDATPDLGAAYLVLTLVLIVVCLVLLVWRYRTLRD